MSELVYTHTIDAGTDILANELQQNFVDAKAIINGNIEGGPAPAGNIKANGITARELADLILVHGLPGAGGREGLVTQPTGVTEAMLVTPGANRDLNYGAGTAWVRDDSGVIAAGALIPVTINSGAVSVPANASGNPRLDQIILTMNGYGTGTVSVLQGTPNAATTLNNRTGAATLPNDTIRIADALTINGFAGPFVNHTSLRNRIPWAVPMMFNPAALSTGFEFVIDSFANDLVEWQFQLELTNDTSAMWQVEGATAGVYQTAADEVQLTTAGVLTRATRGGYGGTSASFGINTSTSGTLPMRVMGHYLFDLTNAFNWWMAGGDTTTVWTGGAPAMSHFHVGNTVSHAGPLTWMKMFPLAGTFQGYVKIDRRPRTATP